MTARRPAPASPETAAPAATEKKPRPTNQRASRGRSGSAATKRFAGILDIAERLAETQDRQGLLQAIVDESKVALGSDATVLRLLNEDRLEVVAWSGIDDETAAAMPRHG
jgi:hypothetical protein